MVVIYQCIDMSKDTTFLNDFSREVWQNTYKDHKDNTIDDTLLRVATTAASVESSPAKAKEWTEKFYRMLTNFKATSGGRILSNAGTDWKGTTLMNCFVGPKPDFDQDSIEGIYQTLLAQTLTLKSEGGWGMNFSFIRPRGSFIHGIGVESPGAVKYMELFDKASDVITAGSGKKSKNKEAKGKIRKGAMMGVLDVWHPDIEEFITAKLTPNRLSKFNISVNCTNEFMDKVAEVQRLKGVIADYTNKTGATSIVHEVELDEVEKWNLIYPDTKHPAYKKEWDGNIASWKAKGYTIITHRTIKVSDLWELIMNSTYTRNDPGVLFLDIANKTHAWNYGGPKAHIASTNPCGEQCLPFGGVCNLASINLTQFVDLEDKTFDYAKFREVVPVVVRFLDNINDVTNAPLPEYKESITRRRRIGVGVMGWGSLLYLLNIRFASNEAEELKSLIMEDLTYTAINASVDLAVEKGMFPDCDPKKHSEAEYFNQINLPSEIRSRIARHGIRNSALFSIQPTGNTGVLANNVSGGLEPVFLHEYIRTVIVNVVPDEISAMTPKYWEGDMSETSLFKAVKENGEGILRGEYNGIVFKIDRNRGLTTEKLCEDYAVRILKERNEWDAKADWAVTSSNLTVDEHVRDMMGFGKWIDSSMSKTVNLPNNYSYEDFKNLYLKAYKTGYLKGITTYREGTMLTVLSSTEAKPEESKKIQKTKPPKRPVFLSGELHHSTVGKHKFYTAVGLLDGELYEIFTGSNDAKRDVVPKEVKTGKIRKDARGKYTFVTESGDEYCLNNGHSDDTANALTRMVSCGLRHGADISFVVHQLEKTEGPLTSFSKVLARTLKKYIADGTKVHGDECPSCGSKHLERREGCVACKDCGYSKCS